ncbi:MAG: NADH-quinone oxidoreductase subunit J [Planctomycetes bacterium]|nr:NADH-quinone oxidoreductase subunit J [Planctomycetota bacterium]
MAGWMFILFALLILAGSLGVVALRNVMHSALMLGVALFGVAGVFLLLGADFLAAVQVVVYVSGVLILMLFVVMLTHRLYDRTLAQTNERRLLASVLCLALFVMLGLGITAENAASLRGAADRGFRQWAGIDPVATVGRLGELLLKPYVVPFEVASVLLLAALVGAILFTKREPGKS